MGVSSISMNSRIAACMAMLRAKGVDVEEIEEAMG